MSHKDSNWAFGVTVVALLLFASMILAMAAVNIVRYAQNADQIEASQQWNEINAGQTGDRATSEQ